MINHPVFVEKYICQYLLYFIDEPPAGVPDEISLAPGAPPDPAAPRAPRRLLQHHSDLQPRRQPHPQLGQEGLQRTQAQVGRTGLAPPPTRPLTRPAAPEVRMQLQHGPTGFYTGNLRINYRVLRFFIAFAYYFDRFDCKYGYLPIKPHSYSCYILSDYFVHHQSRSLKMVGNP